MSHDAPLSLLLSKPRGGVRVFCACSAPQFKLSQFEGRRSELHSLLLNSVFAYCRVHANKVDSKGRAPLTSVPAAAKSERGRARLLRMLRAALQVQFAVAAVAHLYIGTRQKQ